MSKFKKKLVQDIKQEKEDAIKQESLRKQHGIQDKDIIIVEKNNIVKFTVQQIIAFIKFIATILILALACIGVLSLIYPNIRNELFTIFMQYYISLKFYF